MKKLKSGGGWHAIGYTWRKARQVGGVLRLWRAMRTKNTCKTCALGMGGQRGGMVNEAGSFPEVCKKSLQAMVADMQGAVRSDFWTNYSVARLQQLSPRELEACGRLVEPARFTRDLGRYEPISWETALRRIIEVLRATPPERTFLFLRVLIRYDVVFLIHLFYGV
jgi:anaerobic selenocysteine-containing dehydrogenase